MAENETNVTGYRQKEGLSLLGELGKIKFKCLKPFNLGNSNSGRRWVNH